MLMDLFAPAMKFDMDPVISRRKTRSTSSALRMSFTASVMLARFSAKALQHAFRFC